eukprot:TRINITY_DN1392_c0_g1_i3.p1 TRINITY_DN1392_c0_g1~~TRINITY_DN1392_c0_g1_i3.p1  ORF type:complete len:792 (+),score=135.03 TRINITY_DN1392_c0_g1_i3:36-2411(+)
MKKMTQTFPKPRGMQPYVIFIDTTEGKITDRQQRDLTGIPENVTIRCLAYEVTLNCCTKFTVYHASLMIGKELNGREVSEQRGTLTIQSSSVLSVRPAEPKISVGKYALLGHHFLSKGGIPVILAYDTESKEENPYYAAKIEDRAAGSSALVKNESYFQDDPDMYYKLVDSFKHPHIVETIDHFETTINNSAVTVTIMELLDHTIRQEVLKKPPTIEKLVDYLLQQISALDYLRREKGVMHSDIKPDNISTKIGILKLIDFDSIVLVKRIGHSDLSKRATQRGTTPYYRTCTTTPKRYDATHSMDMYSTGKTFLVLLDELAKGNKGEAETYTSEAAWLREVLNGWFCQPNSCRGIHCPVLCKALVQRKYTGKMHIVVFTVSDTGYDALEDPLNEVPGPTRKIKDLNQNWTPCGKFRIKRKGDNFNDIYLQAHVGVFIDEAGLLGPVYSVSTIDAIAAVSAEDYIQPDGHPHRWHFVSETEFVWQDEESKLYWKHTISSTRERGPDMRRVELSRDYDTSNPKQADTVHVDDICSESKWGRWGLEPVGVTLRTVLERLLSAEGGNKKVELRPKSNEEWPFSRGGACDVGGGGTVFINCVTYKGAASADWFRVELAASAGKCRYHYKRTPENKAEYLMSNRLIRIAVRVCLELCGIDLGIVPSDFFLSGQKVLFIESPMVDESIPIDNGLHKINVKNAAVGVSVISRFFEACNKSSGCRVPKAMFVRLPDGRLQYAPWEAQDSSMDHLIHTFATQVGMKDDFLKTRFKACEEALKKVFGHMSHMTEETTAVLRP